MSSQINESPTFKSIALQMAALNVPTIRLKPKSKEPMDRAWQTIATTNVNTIIAQNSETPYAGCACVAKNDGVCFLEVDEPGVAERYEQETGEKFPEPTVQSRPGRLHYYMRQTPETVACGNISQKELVWGSFRQKDQYVVSAGSIHAVTGQPYQLLSSAIAPAPKRLIEWLVAQRTKSTDDKSKPNLMGDDPIPFGQHDVTLMAIAGKLRQDGLDYEEMLPVVARHAERCVGRGADWYDMVQNKCRSACRYPAGDPTPTVLIGGKLPGESVVAAPPPKTSVDVLDEESVARMNTPKEKKASQTLRYPLHVWDGTLYGDFAEVCGEKNKVAREFFAESVKTVVGSICGHRIQTKESRGQQPARFYTILIGPGGGGKSSAQKWAEEMFFGTGYLPETSQSLTFINIGAMKCCYSSATGLVEKGYSKSARLVQIYDEVTTLVEKFGINGSGDTYLDQINGMFEAGYTPQGVTKTTKESTVFRGPAEHSILGCTTEVKWKNAFRKTSTEKSGFFQRLNIVTNDSEERVADFNPPDLSHLREKFIRKIAPLEYQQVEVEVLPEATELLDKWFESKQATWRDMSTDVTGRLQVLVKRNAAHIAWLLNGDEGTLDPENPDSPIVATCDADVMQRAIDLSEYQERARLIHRPVLAENDYALMEGLIEQHFLKNDAPITRNNLRRTIHAERFGSKKFDDVIRTLEQDGMIQIKGLPNENRRGRKTQVIVWLGDEE